MSSFQAFGEAARLYAENVNVVTAMRKAMETDLLEFVNYLREEVEQLIQPSELHENMTPKWCTWYLEEGKPWVGFEHLSPSIVVPGELKLYVNAPKNRTPKQKARILALARLQELEQLGVKQSKDGLSLLTTIINYSTGNPIPVVSPVIATLLPKITDAW